MNRTEDGHIWAASADGCVYTTAPTKWATMSYTSPRNYLYAKGSPTWKATTLFDINDTLVSFYAVSDKEAYAGTWYGSIFKWNGKKWKEVHYEPAGSIYHFLSLGKGQILAVGDQSLILYHNGKTWKKIADPEGNKADVWFVGAVQVKKDFFICDHKGRILKGTRCAFEVIAKTKNTLWGMKNLGDRVFLAAGTSGVAELIEKKVKIINKKIKAIRVTQGIDRLIFYPSTQKSAYYLFDPTSEKNKWQLAGF